MRCLVRMGSGLAVALALAGCVSSSSLESYRPKTQVEEQVVAMLRRIPTGINSRSLDLVMQPYADDAYIGNFHKYLGISGPGAAIRISKQELRMAYAQLFKDVKEVSMDVKNFRLTVSGGRATAEARTELLLKQERVKGESGREVIRNDVTWRLRSTPGGWKIVEEIFQ